MKARYGVSIRRSQEDPVSFLDSYARKFYGRPAVQSGQWFNKEVVPVRPPLKPATCTIGEALAAKAGR